MKRILLDQPGMEELRDKKEELQRWDSRGEGSRVRYVKMGNVYLTSVVTYATKKKNVLKKKERNG